MSLSPPERGLKPATTRLARTFGHARAKREPVVAVFSPRFEKIANLQSLSPWALEA